MINSFSFGLSVLAAASLGDPVGDYVLEATQDSLGFDGAYTLGTITGIGSGIAAAGVVRQGAIRAYELPFAT